MANQYCNNCERETEWRITPCSGWTDEDIPRTGQRRIMHVTESYRGHTNHWICQVCHMERPCAIWGFWCNGAERISDYPENPTGSRSIWRQGHPEDCQVTFDDQVAIERRLAEQEPVPRYARGESLTDYPIGEAPRL